MLLLLDDSLIDLFENNNFESILYDSLENLSLAHREGKHILLASRLLLTKIIEANFSSEKTLGTLIAIKNRLPQYSNIITELKRYVKILPPEYSNIEFISQGVQKILQVSIDKFEDSAIVQETILLAENLTDTNLYQLMGKVYAFNKRLSNFPVRAQAFGGGGDQVVNQYGSIRTNDNRFCLCIVDSDKKSPKSEPGVIARRLIKIDEEEVFLTEAVISSLRESENMLSCNQLSEVCSGDSNCMATLDYLEWIEEQGLDELRQYIDFNKGIKLDKIYKLSDEDPVRSYWTEYIPLLIRDQEKVGGPCLSSGACVETPECNCVIMPGFGDTILARTIDKLNRKSIQKISESICNLTEHEWFYIGMLVFSWCCGRNRVAV